MVRLSGEFLTDLARPDTLFHQDLRGKAFFLPQRAKQQMLRADMFVGEAIRFLQAIRLGRSRRAKACG